MQQEKLEDVTSHLRRKAQRWLNHCLFSTFAGAEVEASAFKLIQRGTETLRCEHVPTQICSYHVGSGAQWLRPARSSDGKPESGLPGQRILINKTALIGLQKAGRIIPQGPVLSPKSKQPTLI